MPLVDSAMSWLLADLRRWWVFSAGVLALGLMWTWASRVPEAVSGSERLPSPRAGFPAPDFTLETLDGDTASLADYRGRVIILNFWASWCGPCRAEMPALQALWEAQRERGLVVLAINSTVQDSVPAATAFLQKMNLNLPVLIDRDGAATQRYLVRALPTTFFVDRQGIIRSMMIGGPVSAAVLQTQVEPLLAEDGTADRVTDGAD
ncbi:MAG: TlpA disulfide reductase family protein [Anaerolineales bacterium]|nr:TlpA disulfide reductase family protein [Anaerolineales bacterium]